MSIVDFNQSMCRYLYSSLYKGKETSIVWPKIFARILFVLYAVFFHALALNAQEIIPGKEYFYYDADELENVCTPEDNWCGWASPAPKAVIHGEGHLAFNSLDSPENTIALLIHIQIPCNGYGEGLSGAVGSGLDIIVDDSVVHQEIIEASDPYHHGRRYRYEYCKTIPNEPLRVELSSNADISLALRLTSGASLDFFKVSVQYEISDRPVISLNSDHTQVIGLGEQYSLPSPSVYDYQEGDITELLHSSGDVDVNVPGAYPIRYNAQDEEGYHAYEKIFTVHVIDRNQSSEDRAYEYLKKVMDQYHNQYYLYSDANSGGNHGTPSGWMADEELTFAELHVDHLWSANCYSGNSCFKSSWGEIEGDWIGIRWLQPENNWGDDARGGVDLSGATTLSFYARGETGTEEVRFLAGGTEGEFPGSIQSEISTGSLTLSQAWTHYSISLSSYDLTNVISPFGWVANNGATFYIDDVKIDFAQPDALRFLQSFEILDPVKESSLANVSYGYDNALALLAFLARGEADDLRRARILADAFVFIVDNDRYFGEENGEYGRIRNGYMSGDLEDPATGKARMPGWWVAKDGKWYEDSFNVSIHTGNVAWPMIALIAYYNLSGEQKYLDATLAMANWLEEYTLNTSAGNIGGYLGGFEGWEDVNNIGDTPRQLTYAATEHNIDLVPVFKQLFTLLGEDSPWEMSADNAENMVDQMWNGDHLLVGTTEDGFTINDSNKVTDIQAWAVMAMPYDERYRSSLAWAEENTLTLADDFEGFDFNDNKDGVWFEGTAQMALAFKINKEFEKAEFYLSELRRAQVEANNSNGKGLVAASKDPVDTGFSWKYFSRNHVGATAWYLLAERGYNPYWSTFSCESNEDIPQNNTVQNFINNGDQLTGSPMLSLDISATDSNGISAYYVTHSLEENTPEAPSLTDGGWRTVSEATHFSESISYLADPVLNDQNIYLHVWVRDKCGAISEIVSNDIYFSDHIDPVNTTEADFAGDIIPTSNLASVSINIKGEDEGGINSYFVMDSNSSDAPNTPLVNDNRWIKADFNTRFISSAEYTLSTSYPMGTEVWLFVWVKDAAGNISLVQSDSFFLQAFYDDFESITDKWTIENGVWEIGVPEAGPAQCYSGTQCAATILDNVHPANDDSRLISSPINLPDITDTADKIYFSFWQWFSYSSYDAGYIQVSVQNDDDSWSEWVDVGNSIINVSDWSFNQIDISSYSSETIRIAFYHTAARDGYNRGSESYGWYIDDAGISIKEREFSGDFDNGWESWGADRGIWQIGTPSSGPAACYEGECIGTYIGANYNGYTDSRLISAETNLDSIDYANGERLMLSFWQWFSYSSYDSGTVQISQKVEGEWSEWENIGNSMINVSDWSFYQIDLSDYAGKTVRLGFNHTAGRDSYNRGSESHGWFLDSIAIEVKSPSFSGDFDNGWESWGADRGIWQIGTPSSGPAACYEGECIGTYIGANYNGYTDSRLISAETNLDSIDYANGERLMLSFWQWFSYSSYDSGTVQISQKVEGEWSEWENIGNSMINVSDWSFYQIDLSDYAGKTVRLGFNHTAGRDSYNRGSESHGWFLDSIAIEVKSPSFSGDFDNGWESWGADRGIWQIGTPSSGPAACYEGECIGTYIGANYNGYTDSRLISAETNLDSIDYANGERLMLSFWQWFSYSSYDSGTVQISQKVEGEWSEWENIGNSMINVSDWSFYQIDLSDYAGKTVRLGFNHTAGRDSYNRGSESHGWFLDSIAIEVKSPSFSGDFDNGWESWGADRGIWQIGTPSSGPAACYEGECIGTYIGANYNGYTDSRLISAETNLDSIDYANGERLMLSFWQWFSYSSYDSGTVQISQKVEGEWSEWENIGNSMINVSDWSFYQIDLSDYAGQTVRLGFNHTAGRDSYNRGSESYGWFLDNIAIEVKSPSFSGDFDNGWESWGADRGIWQIGTPSSGPAACYEGECIGTYIGANYNGYTDSRLISAETNLDSIDYANGERLMLSFWQWFSYSSYDSGTVQISQKVEGEWSEWENIGNSMINVSDWSFYQIDLSDYAGKTVRLGFNHTAGRDSYNRGSESHGWFLDSIAIEVKSPSFSGDFDNGWESWGADRGIWQIGTPSSGPAACYEGECIGTYIGANYNGYTDSRLISAETNLDSIDYANGERLMLSFWQWFSYSSYDSGTVQISQKVEGEWSEWENIGNSMINVSDWSFYQIDLSDYAGKTVRLGFNHTAGRDSYNRGSESHGWFLDSIAIEVKSPSFSGDFDNGWESWGADRGIWQIGTPSSGPAACYEGECIGTYIGANYNGYTDSRLISAEVYISDGAQENVLLNFMHWHSYSSYDVGYIQVSQKQDDGSWGDWVNVGESITGVSDWISTEVSLEAYVGKTIRIAFYHTAARDSYNRASESHGWFLDNISLSGSLNI